jgi:hypothetical protein
MRTVVFVWNVQKETGAAFFYGDPSDRYVCQDKIISVENFCKILHAVMRKVWKSFKRENL